MFAKTTNVGFAQRVVATLVASALVMVSYGFYNNAQAANLLQVSNTLSDSAPGALPSHTIDFEIPTDSSLLTSDTISIIVPATFTVGAVTAGDLTITENVGGTESTPTATSVAVNSQTITFAGVEAAAGETVRVVIADGLITNPAIKVLGAGIGDSYEFTITTDDGSTAKDAGKTRVIIMDTVLVTAIVETTFEFTITGTASSTSVNSDTTTGTTSATEIPFGVLTSGAAKVLSQKLNVQTNARNGFSVTVESDSELESSTGAIIDTFLEGSDIAVSGQAWLPPVPVVTDETSWGHWGMTSNDTDLGDELVTTSSYIAVSSTTPREVFSHNGPSDNTTQDVGEATVGYKIEITALQEAGDDYNTTLTYIATPTF